MPALLSTVQIRVHSKKCVDIETIISAADAEAAPTQKRRILKVQGQLPIRGGGARCGVEGKELLQVRMCAEKRRVWWPDEDGTGKGEEDAAGGIQGFTIQPVPKPVRDNK
eukprot:1020995-Pelagomonas_calceolata.AAC.2